MNKRRILHGKRRRRSPLRNGGNTDLLEKLKDKGKSLLVKGLKGLQQVYEPYEFNIGDYTVKSDSALDDPTVYDSKGNVSKIGTFIAKHRNKPVIRNIINAVSKYN